MNKVILTGRTTKDMELRCTPSNISILQFTLAVKRNFKNTNGKYESDFINCMAFRKTAELISQYTKKGDKLEISGRIQTRNYEDKQGNKRVATEVIVDEVEFLESKQKKEEKSNSEILKDVMEDKDPFAEIGEQVTIEDNFLE